MHEHSTPLVDGAGSFRRWLDGPRSLSQSSKNPRTSTLDLCAKAIDVELPPAARAQEDLKVTVDLIYLLRQVRRRPLLILNQEPDLASALETLGIGTGAQGRHDLEFSDHGLCVPMSQRTTLHSAVYRGAA